MSTQKSSVDVASQSPIAGTRKASVQAFGALPDELRLNVSFFDFDLGWDAALAGSKSEAATPTETAGKTTGDCPTAPASQTPSTSDTDFEIAYEAACWFYEKHTGDERTILQACLRAVTGARRGRMVNAEASPNAGEVEQIQKEKDALRGTVELLRNAASRQDEAQCRLMAELARLRTALAEKIKVDSQSGLG